MSKAVYKYPMFGTRVPMPKGAVPLHVALQRDKEHVWALVDKAETRIVNHEFAIYATGEEIPDGPMRHLITIHVPNGYFGTLHTPEGLIWHVFYKGEVE